MKSAYRLILTVLGVLLPQAVGLVHAEEFPYSGDLVNNGAKAANARVGVHTQQTQIGEFQTKGFSKTSTTTDAKDAEQALPQAEQYDLGQNTATQVTVPLRNMQAFGQMADSEDLQKHFKALLKKRVPVHYMTMMMVENGAATGFIGAMAGLNGVYENTIQTHGLQLAQLQAFDQSGMAVKQYEKTLAEQMQVPGHQDAFIPALWAVNADVIDPDSSGGDSGPKPLPMRYKHPQELMPTKGAQADPRIDPNKLDSPDIQKEKKLSKILIDAAKKEANGASGEKHKNQDAKLNAFEQEFVELLGDVKLSVEDKNGAHLRTIQFIQPKEKDGRRAIDYVDRQNIEQVWKSTQEVLKEYCKFKASDQNYDSQIFQKKRPASVLEDKKDERDKASAPDMPLTVPYVDQIFRLMASGQPIAAGKCDTMFDPSIDKMPSVDDTSGSADTFDDCDKKPKQCLRNKVILTGVKLVARSRTLHQYLYLLETAHQLAREPEYNSLINNMAESILETVNLESEIEDNRERWMGFSNFLSKLAQGQATGSVFRPMVSAAGSNQ